MPDRSRLLLRPSRHAKPEDWKYERREHRRSRRVWASVGPVGPRFNGSPDSDIDRSPPQLALSTYVSTGDHRSVHRADILFRKGCAVVKRVIDRYDLPVRRFEQRGSVASKSPLFVDSCTPLLALVNQLFFTTCNRPRPSKIRPNRSALLADENARIVFRFIDPSSPVALPRLCSAPLRSPILTSPARRLAEVVRQVDKPKNDVDGYRPRTEPPSDAAGRARQSSATGWTSSPPRR